MPRKRLDASRAGYATVEAPASGRLTIPYVRENIPSFISRHTRRVVRNDNIPDTLDLTERLRLRGPCSTAMPILWQMAEVFWLVDFLRQSANHDARLQRTGLPVEGLLEGVPLPVCDGKHGKRGCWITPGWRSVLRGIGPDGLY